METVFTVLGTAWAANLLAWGLPALLAFYEKHGLLRKPFTCGKCMGFWLGALLWLGLCPLAQWAGIPCPADGQPAYLKFILPFCSSYAAHVMDWLHNPFSIRN